jgi:DNA-directed RNA polymerase subunit alpha
MELRPLLMPKKLFCESSTLTNTYGKFFAEPFEQGYGTTLGNSLRRVLLSSLQGAAIVSVRFEDVKHELSSIEGIKEDVPDIILNLKSINLKMLSGTGSTTIYLDAKGAKKVTAADFEPNSNVEILNPDVHIATLSRGARLKIEAVVALGRGYVPATQMEEEREKQEIEDEIGLIFVDAAFSPIRNVKYYVENARVGHRTDYDRLVMEIWTNGSVEPEEAISYGARILRDQLELFITVEEDKKSVTAAEEEEKAVSPVAEMEEKLSKSIEELELSVRSFNCLEAAGIKTIRDLVQKTEQEMLKYRNFGRKSLSEIKNILKDMGLSFNMKLDERGLPITLPEEKE